MNNKCKNVVDYYVLCCKLKDLIRTGWKRWKVNRDRLESVAEHIFGVQSLAIAVYSEYEYKIDLYKVILMLAVHELEEIYIGDLITWEISQEEKNEKGHIAIENILSPLKIGHQIKDLIIEFDERKTNEAIFAYHCDKLECDLQCKLYDEKDYVDMNNQNSNYIYHDNRIQEIIKKGNNKWSDMWLEYDRDKFADDNNFIEILDYIKNNNISIE